MQAVQAVQAHWEASASVRLKCSSLFLVPETTQPPSHIIMNLPASSIRFVSALRQLSVMPVKPVECSLTPTHRCCLHCLR